jgi:hypothetical protein
MTGTPRPMSRTWRRIAATWVALSLAVASLLVVVAPTVAADPVEFGTPTSSSTYGTSINFKQPVDLATVPTRVELLMQTPGAAGPGVIDVDAPTRSGPSTLTFSVSLADGHIVPNTTFVARWRVTDADGKTWVGPPVSQTYADTRVDWKTLKGKLVTVHWYQGGDAFVQRPRKIGDDAVAETSQLLGVTETDPIDFFIYADQDKFYDALGPATRENVGGEAHADIRTMFALITPARSTKLGVDGRPARADPPRLRHGDEEPLPRAAALAERGARRLSLGGLRIELPQPGRERGEGRLDHAAGRPGRRVPDDPRPVLPGVRRERLRGGLDRREQGP